MGLNKLGSLEFRDAIRKQGSAYSIFAAKAPVEKLAGELRKLFQVEEWQQNVSRNGKLGDLVGVPVVQFKGSPWAIAYWSIGRYLNIKNYCCQLSGKLDIRVIQLWETDSSSWVEWVVWENGYEREGAERMIYDNEGDEGVYFRSSLRKNQGFDNFDAKSVRAALDSSIDELLTKQGIYIPTLDFNLSNSEIERLDVLVLPSKPLGMLDFQKYIYEGHPEYSIFAVKAPIDKVLQAVAKYQPNAKWEKDIQSSKQIWNVVSKNNQYWMPIIQPKNNDWTVVYWVMGNWADLSQMCGELSSTMQTKVMNLSEEDTSGAVGYQLFEQGEQVEDSEWAPGFEFAFESKLQDEPEFDDFEEDEEDVIIRFINERFIKEGIYIPAWDLNVSDAWLERVDLMLRS